MNGRFITKVFPNLAWILITADVLSPQNDNMRSLEGPDHTFRKPELNWHLASVAAKA